MNTYFCACHPCSQSFRVSKRCMLISFSWIELKIKEDLLPSSLQFIYLDYQHTPSYHAYLNTNQHLML